MCFPAVVTLLFIGVNLFFAGVCILLLLLATFIAGAEVAVLTLSAVSLEKFKNQTDRKSLIIQKYIDEPEKLHLTVSVVTIIIIAATFFMILPVFKNFLFLENCDWVIFSLLVVGYSLVLLVFTELLPRFFSKVSDRYLLFIVYPVKAIEIIVSPITYLIEKISGNKSRRLIDSKHHISLEDISSALELTSDPRSDEEDILKGIVNFGNIDVQKILKPRIDVVAVEKNIDTDTLFQIVVESGYSRIPVFAETFDNIVGVLYVKDLLPHLKEMETFHWNSVIRPAYFVPETKKVKELLNELQIQKIHMAVVVDEYGGNTGIVTLEDILEEIVGEISDESDEDEQTYIQLDDNTFLFDGITLLNDFYHITQTSENIFDDVRGDADTLAGLILEIKGDIPENGDELDFEPFHFVITQVDNRRIRQVKVIINKKGETEEEKS